MVLIEHGPYTQNSDSWEAMACIDVQRSDMKDVKACGCSETIGEENELLERGGCGGKRVVCCCSNLVVRQMRSIVDLTSQVIIDAHPAYVDCRRSGGGTGYSPYGCRM